MKKKKSIVSGNTSEKAMAEKERRMERKRGDL